jgi:hypothetical protein
VARLKPTKPLKSPNKQQNEEQNKQDKTKQHTKFNTTHIEDKHEDNRNRNRKKQTNEQIKEIYLRENTNETQKTCHTMNKKRSIDESTERIDTRNSLTKTAKLLT